MGNTYKCPICGKIWYTIADVDKCFNDCKSVAKLAEQKRELEKQRAAERAKIEKSLNETRFEINKTYVQLKALVNSYNSISDGFYLKYPNDYKRSVCTTSLSFSDTSGSTRTTTNKADTNLNDIIDSLLKF